MDCLVARVLSAAAIVKEILMEQLTELDGKVILGQDYFYNLGDGLLLHSCYHQLIMSYCNFSNFSS